MFNEKNSYLDRCIIPTMALNGMEGASKTIKIMWKIKLFNHKKSLIRNFLGTWYFQFVVFQNQFAIVDFRSLNANAVLKKNKGSCTKYSRVYVCPEKSWSNNLMKKQDTLFGLTWKGNYVIFTQLIQSHSPVIKQTKTWNFFGNKTVKVLRYYISSNPIDVKFNMLLKKGHHSMYN